MRNSRHPALAFLPHLHPPADAQTSTDIEVDAILPVTPGNVYAVSGVDWKGASAISTKEVAALVNLPVGQPADACVSHMTSNV